MSTTIQRLCPTWCIEDHSEVRPGDGYDHLSAPIATIEGDPHFDDAVFRTRMRSFEVGRNEDWNADDTRVEGEVHLDSPIFESARIGMSERQLRLGAAAMLDLADRMAAGR